MLDRKHYTHTKKKNEKICSTRTHHMKWADIFDIFSSFQEKQDFFNFIYLVNWNSPHNIGSG